MAHAITLSPQMGPAVLAHLSKCAELPKFGCIAGQAVASAIDDLFGAGGGIYNDIDVFVPVSTPAKARTPQHASPLVPRGEFAFAESTSYGGAVHRHLEMVQTYRIEHVAYEGLVNKVYYQMPREASRMADNTWRVIQGFDINAVRVGVDLRSHQLVWDANYQQFLDTRELRIAACYTPLHTLLRLLKKAQELPGAAVDVETAARICTMLHSEHLFRQLRWRRLTSVVFGTRYARLADGLNSSWAPYFDKSDAWFHRADEGSPWKEGAGDETSVDSKALYQMRPRGELDADDQRFARTLGIESVVTLPAQVYRQRDAQRTGKVVSLGLPDAPSVCADADSPRTSLFAQARGADYYEALSEAETRELEGLLRTHSCAPLTVGMSGREQLDFLRAVNEAISRLPASCPVSSSSFRNALERHEGPVDVARLEAVVRQDFEVAGAPAPRPELLPADDDELPF
jgi:hypothetical protein